MKLLIWCTTPSYRQKTSLLIYGQRRLSSSFIGNETLTSAINVLQTCRHATCWGYGTPLHPLWLPPDLKLLFVFEGFEYAKTDNTATNKLFNSILK